MLNEYNLQAMVVGGLLTEFNIYERRGKMDAQGIIVLDEGIDEMAKGACCGGPFVRFR